jgi:hypothetical protein
MTKSDGNGTPSRQRSQKTREEYLAGSLSRMEPWKAEGISRRTYYRRAPRASAVAPAAPSKPRPAGQHVRREKVQPSVRPPQEFNSDEQKLLRLVEAQLKANVPLKSALRNVHGHLPDRYQTLSNEALTKTYRRALRHRPVEYDRWITLIENWDPSYGRERAQNLVSQWLKVTNDRLPADRRVPFLNHLFGHIEQRNLLGRQCEEKGQMA